MRIYSKTNFFLGLAYLALAAASGAKSALYQGDGFSVFMALAWAVLGILYMYRGLNREKAEKSREASARADAAARELFGKWGTVMQWLGLAPAVLSMMLIAMGRTGPLSMILLLAGLLYTFVIIYIINQRAEK